MALENLMKIFAGSATIAGTGAVARYMVDGLSPEAYQIAENMYKIGGSVALGSLLPVGLLYLARRNDQGGN